MNEQLSTLKETKPFNVMKFKRGRNGVGKYVKAVDGKSEFTIQCDHCGSKQDFDNMSLAKAQEAAKNEGWNEGEDEDGNFHCICPEDFEMMQCDIAVEELDEEYYE